MKGQVEKQKFMSYRSTVSRIQNKPLRGLAVTRYLPAGHPVE